MAARRAVARGHGRHGRAAGNLQAARRPTVEAGMELHEPRPLMPRPRERIIADRVNARAATGRLVLADIYDGRNMAGVKRGEIKKLLVLETLPMPIHYTGGMDPISYGGTFTLERIVGTVPVEEDGSAYFELPALRSFFFVALDENDLSVKRMQSFLTVQPGETTSCVGCHEQRTQTPRLAGHAACGAAPPAQPHRAHRRRARRDRFPARHPADSRRALRELPRLREDRRRRPARRAAHPHRRPRPAVQPQLLHADHRPAVLRRPQPAPEQLRPAHARLLRQPPPAACWTARITASRPPRTRRSCCGSGSRAAPPIPAPTPRWAAA